MKTFIDFPIGMSLALDVAPVYVGADLKVVNHAILKGIDIRYDLYYDDEKVFNALLDKVYKHLDSSGLLKSHMETYQVFLDNDTHDITIKERREKFD